MSTIAEFIESEEDKHYPLHEGQCRCCQRNTLVGLCFIGPEEVPMDMCKVCIEFGHAWQVCMSWLWS